VNHGCTGPEQEDHPPPVTSKSGTDYCLICTRRWKRCRVQEWPVLRPPVPSNFPTLLPIGHPLDLDTGNEFLLGSDLLVAPPPLFLTSWTPITVTFPRSFGTTIGPGSVWKFRQGIQEMTPAGRENHFRCTLRSITYQSMCAKAQSCRCKR